MLAPLTTQQRLELAYDSLLGLSVGDALGERLTRPDGRPAPMPVEVPTGPWAWTDDTQMACGIVAELRDHGGIEESRLAATFAQRFEAKRGYGAGAARILAQIKAGVSWRVATTNAYDGQGSCGNGAAMRAAPLGAYFADDFSVVAEQAARSARVTHQHPEGIAGAVAVAIATALVSAARLDGIRPTPRAVIDAVLDRMAVGQTHSGIKRAGQLLGSSAAEASAELGNGSRAIAQATVPFALWVAATYLDDFRTAIATCVEAGGDVDTLAAIAGGVIGAYVGDRGGEVGGIPREWVVQREPLPVWVAQH